MNKLIEFYSLLYFSDGENLPNLSRFLKKEKDSILIRNAYNLSQQIHKLGFKHTLITNNKKKIFEYKNYNFPIETIPFKKVLNEKTKFFSTHFKVDVYKFLSTKNNISCLLDIDILIINKFSKQFINELKKNNLLYSQDRESLLINDINYILKKTINMSFKNPLWYGGEFISGNSKFYKLIYEAIQNIYPVYKNNINNFFHQGDETLLNIAIHYLNYKKKISFKDINGKKIIQRHWSVLRDDRKKLNFHLENVLIHIPSDKYFLANFKAGKFDFDSVKKKYAEYHNSIYRRIVTLLKLLLKPFR